MTKDFFMHRVLPRQRLDRRRQPQLFNFISELLIIHFEMTRGKHCILEELFVCSSTCYVPKISFARHEVLPPRHQNVLARKMGVSNEEMKTTALPCCSMLNNSEPVKNYRFIVDNHFVHPVIESALCSPQLNVLSIKTESPEQIPFHARIPSVKMSE
jgi:hypothetical protein